MSPAEQLLRDVYAAFNARNIDAILPVMCDDVVWPNGMEGGVVHGHSEVRAYWTRQWAILDPKVTPVSVREKPDGALEIEVHQLVKDTKGAVLLDRTVHHVYRMRDGRIASMDIRE
jgi:ketosteroid isomerase-like protein